MAKFGLLYLYGGKWEGKQIIPKDWVATSTKVHAYGDNDKNYGYTFWVYPSHYGAEGLGDQVIQVVKDREMVVVMTAAIDWRKGQVLEDLLRDYIIPAAKSDSPLPANPPAFEDLQAKVRSLANPVQPVPALPETAERISGKTYVIEDNPAGWKSLTATFEEGSPLAHVTLVNAVGEVSVQVGLDNVYRIAKLPDGNTIALRGQWEGGSTFVVRQLQSSPNVEEVEMSFDYKGNDLAIHAQETVFGNYTFDMKGAAK